MLRVLSLLMVILYFVVVLFKLLDASSCHLIHGAVVNIGLVVVSAVYYTLASCYFLVLFLYVNKRQSFIIRRKAALTIERQRYRDHRCYNGDKTVCKSDVNSAVPPCKGRLHHRKLAQV